MARTPGLGPVGIARLIAHYETPSAAIEALPERARHAGRSVPVIPAADRVQREIDMADRAGVRLICLSDPDYPPALAAIPDAPPVIAVKGRVELLDTLACGLVGARNASAAGLRLARELAHGLGTAEVCVVSGLARGIDGACHAGALETGTVAVLAGGLDHVYPPEHDRLHAAIAEQGALVSEMPLGHVPKARDFPRRNRLISGLSRGVLVIEAALRSGSLITARLAAEQGREVMAVPGSPIDPRARGSNRLLRDGAHLIESVEDILAILRDSPPLRVDVREPAVFAQDGLDADDMAGFWEHEVMSPPDALPAEPETPQRDDPVACLRALLSPSPVSPDELARQSGLPAGQVAAALMELEQDGALARLPGGLVQAC
nr:DNA-processing protein DprA [Maricaulis parjimensis]